MTQPRISLNASIDWFRLLDVLELESSTSRALPAVAQCPSCRKDLLLILPDETNGGQWHWCRGCGISGDMVELASRVWELGIEVSLRRLRRQGFPLQLDAEAVKYYRTRFLQPRQKTAKLWEKAQRKMRAPSARARGVMNRLGLQGSTEQPRWGSSGGAMLGSLNVEDIAIGLDIVSPRKVFPGRGWDSTLLFPLFDLPGRISGFLVIGREGEPDRDWILIDSRTASRAKAHPDKLGLAYHPAVPAGAEPHIYIAEDPVVAYRLQERHLRLSTIPLPVVAKPSSRQQISPAVLHMFSGRELRVWSFTDSASAICQAIPLNAQLISAGPETPDPDAVRGYFHRLSSSDIINVLDRESRPWPAVLSARFESAIPGEAEAMLSRLETAGFDLNQVRKRLSREANHKLQSLLDLENTVRTVTVNNKQVLEKDCQWYVAGKQQADELILNASLRIDYVVQHRRVGRAYYRGRVLWRGEAIEFACPKPEFDRDPFGWLEQFLLEQGKGILKFSKRWSSQAVFIASQFHEPRFVVGADHVGYEREENAFRMPSYDMRSGGEIVEHEFTAVANELPATELPRPRTVSAEDFEPLQSPVVLAIIAAILRNITASFCGEERTVIGLVGAGADGLGKDICRALGCREFSSIRPVQFEQIWEEESRHDWPVLVEMPTNRKSFSQWIYPDRRVEERNCVLRIDWYTWQLQRLLGQWVIIREQQSAVLSPEQRVAIQDVVPAYLHDLAKRNFVIEAHERASNGFFWERVFWDFYTFMRRSGSRYARPGRAIDCIHPRNSEDRALGFAELLGDFAAEGRVLVVPEGFEEASDKPLVSVLRPEGSRDGVRVGKADFVRLAASRGALLTDLSEVSLVLAEAGVLIEDADTSWTVDYEWWRSTWRTGMTQSDKRLRLLG